MVRGPRAASGVLASPLPCGTPTRSPPRSGPGCTERLLADRFDVEEFDDGRQLVTEGRAGYSFSLLGRGTVSVTHEGRQVRTLQAERPDVADALQSAISERLAAN